MLKTGRLVLVSQKGSCLHVWLCLQSESRRPQSQPGLHYCTDWSISAYDAGCHATLCHLTHLRHACKRAPMSDQALGKHHMDQPSLVALVVCKQQDETKLTTVEQSHA